MRNASVGLALLCIALPGVAGSSARLANDAGSYRFQKAPVNSLGVQSLAELRGKPVLIDFWGTR